MSVTSVCAQVPHALRCDLTACVCAAQCADPLSAVSVGATDLTRSVHCQWPTVLCGSVAAASLALAALHTCVAMLSKATSEKQAMSVCASVLCV